MGGDVVIVDSPISGRRSLAEHLMDVNPLPEVQQAVDQLMNSRKCAEVSFFDVIREENIEGKEVHSRIPDDQYEAKIARMLEEAGDDEEAIARMLDEAGDDEEKIAKMLEEAGDDEGEEIVERMYGMPLISLCHHIDAAGVRNLYLELRMSKREEVEDSPSQYAQFCESRFYGLFEEHDSMYDIAVAVTSLGLDSEAAVRLISYYIRYYGYGKDRTINIRNSPTDKSTFSALFGGDCGCLKNFS